MNRIVHRFYNLEIRLLSADLAYFFIKKIYIFSQRHPPRLFLIMVMTSVHLVMPIVKITYNNVYGRRTMYIICVCFKSFMDLLKMLISFIV